MGGALNLEDLREQCLVPLLPHLGLMPVPQPPPAGHPGPESQLLRQQLSRDPGVQDEQDAAQHLAVIQPPTAGVIGPLTCGSADKLTVTVRRVSSVRACRGDGRTTRYAPVSRSWLSSLAELRAYDVQVPLWERRICGIEYLGHVTLLLQRARLASPAGGLWEAADFQWWWRRDQHDDPEHQVFWVDGDHAAAAVVLTNWGDRYGCDLLAADHNLCAMLPIVWPVACAAIDSVGDDPVEMMIRDDDAALIDAATASGFSVTDDVSVATWMPAAGRPVVSTIAEGFALTDRSMRPVWPHHLARRNGDQVAERLAECSLYRPDLDIAVYAPDGEVAAYGLFWADPVTGVGLVEPMRTEDRYQGMGLGRHVLTTGLNRLTALGCQRFKVSYVTGNDASRRLYLGVGFHPESTSRTYRTS